MLNKGRAVGPGLHLAGPWPGGHPCFRALSHFYLAVDTQYLAQCLEYGRHWIPMTKGYVIRISRLQLL